MNMSEIWKQLVIDNINYDYEVSNLGNIRSFSRKKILKGSLRNGYLGVSISKNNIKKTYDIHQLVILTFIGKKEHDLIVVNHKNGIKTDNRFENLEYCTRTMNTKHAIDNNLLPKITKKVNKLDPITFKILETYNSMLEAGEANNIDARHISCVCKGKRKTTGGYAWEYVNDINILKIQEDSNHKQILNWENYLISKDGKVYSKRLEKYLEPKTLPNGYQSVKLCNNKIMRDYYIHVLVGEHYLEMPKIDRKLLVINHKDGNKKNNNLNNLEWATQTENMNHYQTVLKKTKII